MTYFVLLVYFKVHLGYAPTLLKFNTKKECAFVASSIQNEFSFLNKPYYKCIEVHK